MSDGMLLVQRYRIAPHARFIETTQRLVLSARLHSGLASAEASWRRLEKQGGATPFQLYDWIEMVVRDLACAASDEVLVVEVLDAHTGEAVMLLPLVRRQRQGYRLIEWLNFGVCDYSAPLVDCSRTWSAMSIAETWAAVKAVLPVADVLRIDAIPQQIGDLLNPLALLPQARLSTFVAYGLPLSGDSTTVVEKSCSPSFLRRVGKFQRRLERRGQVQFVEAQTETEVEAIFAALLAQRRLRFRKLGRFDLLNNPAVASFYRNAALQGLSSGAVRLLGLRVDQEWVATYYGLAHNRRYQGLLITIAGDSWESCSPGLQLHLHVIQWARRQGLEFFDMSVGALSYKEEIGGRPSSLFAIEEAMTLRGRCLLLCIRTARAAKTWLEERPRLGASVRNLRRGLRRWSAKLGDHLLRKSP